MDIKNITLDLIGYKIFGKALDQDLKNLIDIGILESVYSFSKHHDMAHIVGAALAKLGFSDDSSEVLQKLSKQQMLSFYRYKQITHTLNQVCNAFSDAKIPHIPLKGSVMRNYYPEPWMRTSCDIDVLVKRKDLNAAKIVLESDLKYKFDKNAAYDVSYFSDSGVHIELHFDLLEEGSLDQADELLNKVWDVAYCEDGSFTYKLSDEMFYFYHIVHMAKHFFNGGCGIRPFVDLAILDAKFANNREKNDKLLEAGGLLKFAEKARHLSRVWFFDEEREDSDIEFEKYVLSGGVYGQTSNRLSVQQVKRGGKIKYVVSRLFMSYDWLKAYYPILEKHKWLTPFCQVRRWFRLIFKRGCAKQSLDELKKMNSVSAEEAKAVGEMLKELGLE